MPTLVLQNQSPFQWLFNHTPDYDFLRTFGCLFFFFLRPYHAHKLDFRSSPCVFLGYSSSHLSYRCLDLASQHIYISRHVCFHENVFPFANSEQIAPPISTSTQPTHLPTLITSPVFHPVDPPITPPSGSVTFPAP
jgi:histone deacetylase 1/2